MRYIFRIRLTAAGWKEHPAPRSAPSQSQHRLLLCSSCQRYPCKTLKKKENLLQIYALTVSSRPHDLDRWPTLTGGHSRKNTKDCYAYLHPYMHRQNLAQSAKRSVLDCRGKGVLQFSVGSCFETSCADKWPVFSFKETWGVLYKVWPKLWGHTEFTGWAWIIKPTLPAFVNKTKYLMYDHGRRIKELITGPEKNKLQVTKRDTVVL